MDVAGEIRRCLVELDIDGICGVWGAFAPHLRQPSSHGDVLAAMHLARTKMSSLPPPMREWSRRWIADHAAVFPKIAAAVGVAVKPIGSIARARDTHDAMVEAVNDSIKAGLDIDLEADEVRRRMLVARNKIVKAT